MTKTNKINKIVSITVFMFVCFATATYADSFVNQGTMSSLKDFTFGQTLSSMDRTDHSVAYSNQGDSFVNIAAIEALNDFKFGAADATSYTVASNMNESVLKGDSFVNFDTLNELESVRTINLTLRR